MLNNPIFRLKAVKEDLFKVQLSVSPKNNRDLKMQYVGRAIGSVSKTWSSINPSTLSGAIDVIVVEHPDGTLACSPFHVRFGKFRILKPSQKKVEVIVNDKSTNIPMKLGNSGEAYFVFETSSNINDIPNELLSSPVLSAVSSPEQSPNASTADLDKNNLYDDDRKAKSYLEEPDFLDINNSSVYAQDGSRLHSANSGSKPGNFQRNLNKKLTQIHIPSKIDNNGDLLLDIEGYKPDQEKMHDTDEQLKKILKDELGGSYDISNIIREDRNGNIRIVDPYDQLSLPGSPPLTSDFNSDASFSNISQSNDLYMSDGENNFDTKSSEGTSESYTTDTNPTYSNAGQNFIKTIRLTSDQLKCLDLKYGENDLVFSVDQGKAIVKSKLYVWRWDIPIVISDIDGTITKSDALGHVMTMIGKDWTHIGVAKLFTEIARNGYNVMYLTARSAGQADSTRSYLKSIVQNGYKLPSGPVILSPDRTMAALRREVILKKPEIFKIACLNDIRSIYVDKFEEYHNQHNDDDKPTPFVAGFGNRITDALSYRAVGIPSKRIFTINPDGEVHMELLELAGYKSSYVSINELVDQFFPTVKGVDNNYDARSITSMTPGSPINISVDNVDSFNTNLDTKSFFMKNKQEEKFTDLNYWREPLPDVDSLSDLSCQSDFDIDENIIEEARKRNKKIDKLAKENSDIQLLTDTDNGYQRAGNLYNIGSSTPNRRESMTKGEIGSQVYLELGSPLSSPTKSLLTTYDMLDSKKHLDSSLFGLERLKLNPQPVHPTAGVSKVNIFENGHISDMEGSEYEIGPSDDEFDEDEFF